MAWSATPLRQAALVVLLLGSGWHAASAAGISDCGSLSAAIGQMERNAATATQTDRQYFLSAANNYRRAYASACQGGGGFAAGGSGRFFNGLQGAMQALQGMAAIQAQREAQAQADQQQAEFEASMAEAQRAVDEAERQAAARRAREEDDRRRQTIANPFGAGGKAAANPFDGAPAAGAGNPFGGRQTVASAAPSNPFGVAPTAGPPLSNNCVDVKAAKRGNWINYTFVNTCGVAVRFQYNDCGQNIATTPMSKECRTESAFLARNETSMRGLAYQEAPVPRNIVPAR